MGGLVKPLVKRWLKLPADPTPPAGSADSVRVFHAARGYFNYAILRWGVNQVGVLIGILFAFALGSAFFGWMSFESRAATEVLERTPAWVVSVTETLRLVDIQAVPDKPDATRISVGPGWLWLEWLGVFLFLLQLPFSYTMKRLDYELRFYIVTDRSLRIREGITTLRESTMTFDNIQNITIRQGPVQRLFGISDLRVRTAGGGSSHGEDGSDKNDDGKSESMHVGYLRGVDNAEELRDLILTRLKSLKDAGLGADADATPEDLSTALVAAARRMLDETRGLRADLSA